MGTHYLYPFSNLILTYMATKSPLPNRAERRKAQQRKRRNLIILLTALAIPVVGALIYGSVQAPKRSTSSTPQFTKQGTLTVFKGSSDEVIRTFDMELKTSNMDRAEGMMWRKSMEENQGMLFIMDRAEPQSFWMRNTYIPLDIIFIDQQKRILNIRKNAKPQTLDPQPSQGDALYVFEIIGGLSDKLGIQPGDRIAFERD